MNGISIASVVLCATMIWRCGPAASSAPGVVCHPRLGPRRCAHGTFSLVITLFILNPVMGEVYTEVSPRSHRRHPVVRPARSWSGPWAGNLMGLVGGVSTMLYPYIMLGILCLPSMRKAFRPETPPLDDRSASSIPDAS
jgi:hypothetical protein